MKCPISVRNDLTCEKEKKLCKQEVILHGSPWEQQIRTRHGVTGGTAVQGNVLFS